MHPALSVIVFTTLTGAGYGLLFLIGGMSAFGRVPGGSAFDLAAIAVALVLVTAGLLSSTVHLHHPERAWRALSQWRSSWLSREGVAAVLTYMPALLLAFMAWQGDLVSPLARGLGVLLMFGAVATVASTAMIYASLRSIRQWHQPSVLPVYLGFALASGLMWLCTSLAWFGAAGAPWLMAAAAAVALSWSLKWVYWRQIDNAADTSTVQTATGLQGDVRPFDPPHTEHNYLQTEMGFRIARKHAAKLRRIGVLVGAVAPVFGLALSLALPSGAALWVLAPATLAAMGGLVIERWLFFAEATHTVAHYYGMSDAGVKMSS